jgi:hypothetical protein
MNMWSLKQEKFRYLQKIANAGFFNDPDTVPCGHRGNNCVPVAGMPVAEVALNSDGVDAEKGALAHQVFDDH